MDGRFDCLALHLSLVIDRLSPEGRVARTWLQRLNECFVSDFDQSLREMGVGDLSVGRHVKQMVQALHGRFLAYHGALAAAPDDRPLIVALENNLYGTVLETDAASVLAMARYVRSAVAGLAQVPAAQLMAGALPFPALSSAGNGTQMAGMDNGIVAQSRHAG